ncbi:hypothetical protein [Streptomyces sp. NPDC059008]|uniref:hypothetical protein n=1 Tax=Streptomyces sp. NPDC059008 TaxID=3346693 RepID=UPI0036C48F5A
MHDHPTSDHRTEETPLARPEFTLIHDQSNQEWHTTASRQLCRSADFLAAAHHMINSGYHPKAGATTLRLAKVFAARMRTSRHGHFTFAADATARALGVSRRTVMYAAQHLRELGLIAYVEHGTKANVLRTKGTWKPGDGYRATATLFAAVAPPAYDQAHGRRLSGHGYHARIIGVTDQGRRQAVAAARRKAEAQHAAHGTRCTPSVVVSTDHLQVQIEGGKKYTPRKRAARKTSTLRRPDDNRTTPQRCAQHITVAEHLQTEVWWLNSTCSRKLAYALRPLLNAGWSAPSLVAELRTWGVPGHLRNAIAYVHHEVARRQDCGDLPTTPSAHPTPSAQADDHAERYTKLLRSLNGTDAPAWQHYETHLRPALRQALTSRPSQPSRRPTTSCPSHLREPEHLFWKTLTDPGASALEAYRCRGTRLACPKPEVHEGWMAALRDQQAAERAFAELRAELETGRTARAPGCTEGSPHGSSRGCLPSSPQRCAESSTKGSEAQTGS